MPNLHFQGAGTWAAEVAATGGLAASEDGVALWEETPEDVAGEKGSPAGCSPGRGGDGDLGEGEPGQHGCAGPAPLARPSAPRSGGVGGVVVLGRWTRSTLLRHNT